MKLWQRECGEGISGVPAAWQRGRPGRLYGDFFNALLAFVLIAAVVYFFVVVPYTSFRERFEKGPAPEPTKECPECLSAIPERARRCLYCTSEQPQPA